MSSWAYQVDNFEPSPDEDLVCSICAGVFNDPVQSPCQHVFCKSCVFKWLAHSHTCPVCRQTVNGHGIRPAPHLVYSSISQLRVKCPACESDPMSIEDAGKHLCGLVRCRVCPCATKLSLIFDPRQMTGPQGDGQCHHCKLLQASLADKQTHYCVKALCWKLEKQSDELKDKDKRISELLERIQGLELCRLTIQSTEDSELTLADFERFTGLLEAFKRAVLLKSVEERRR